MNFRPSFMEANNQSDSSLPRYSVNRRHTCFMITEVYAQNELAYYFFMCMN
ncbi:MAG: hypothetical protein AB8H47_21605 [Bacteroidia bacterium]